MDDRRRTLIVVLVVGALILPRLTADEPLTPEQTVQSFFAALTDHDQEAALDLLHSSGEGSTIGLLADPADLTFASLDGSGYTPPTGLKITSLIEPDFSEYTTVDEALPTDLEYRLAKLSYTIGDQTMDDVVLVVRPTDSDQDDSWKLATAGATVTVSVNSSDGTAPTVNGTTTQASGSDWTIAALPGSYQVAISAGTLFDSVPQTATVTATSNDQVDLSQRVRTEVQEAADEQVRAYLDTCAASTDPAPSGCPFSASMVTDVPPATVTWSIGAVQDFTYEPGPQDDMLTLTSATGLIGAVDPQTGEELGSTYFTVTGTVTVNGSEVTFSR